MCACRAKLSRKAVSVDMKAETYKYLCCSMKAARASVPTAFDELLGDLVLPPALTTVRVNTTKCSREEVVTSLDHILSSQYSQKSRPKPPILPHPLLNDVIFIPNCGPMDLCQLEKKVVVDMQCGLAVLRGADVFVPGVMGAPKDLCIGDKVSVYADVEGKCRRGLTTEYCGKSYFIGNGHAKVSRLQLFGSNSATSGIAILMTGPLYVAPCLNSVLSDVIYVQNLPSIVVSHVLDPQRGDIVLDMCAAPGGKTTHIAALMKNKGCIVALDKNLRKIKKLRDNIQLQSVSSAHCFAFDATKALAMEEREFNAMDPGPPPYPAECFDRVLLDPPCSALGQRPQLVCRLSVKDVKSYPVYQRKLLTQAIGLLKHGGTLVYSTCTYNPEENELQVHWILKNFPEIELANQTPYIGSHGLPGCQLSEQDTVKVQRFGPASVSPQVDFDHYKDFTALLQDTIGFFIAKFIKH